MPKPESSPKELVTFLDQYRMNFFAGKDPRLSACDRAVLDEIVDRTLKKTGITRPTGITHLVRETGRHSRSVRDSIDRLVSFHYVEIAKKGAGTRGTEYRPNFKWVRLTSESYDAEIDRRKIKRRSTSVRLPNQSSGVVVECAETDSLARQPAPEMPPLRTLVCAPTPSETYFVGPASAVTYEVESSGADGAVLAPARGAEDVEGKIGAPRVEGREVAFELAGTTVRIHYEHDDHRLQEIGQEELSSLAAACGLRTIETGQEIAGKAVALLHLIDGETGRPYRRFRAVAANDNEVSFADNAARG